MKYLALTTQGPVEIGEFPSTDEAFQWASAEYGDDLQAVTSEQETTQTVTAEMPPNIFLGFALLMGGLVLLSGNLKPQKRRPRKNRTRRKAK